MKTQNIDSVSTCLVVVVVVAVSGFDILVCMCVCECCECCCRRRLWNRGGGWVGWGGVDVYAVGLLLNVVVSL